MTSVSFELSEHEEPVSPELALVDPELAERLRALMPVPELDLEPPPDTNVRFLRLTPALPEGPGAEPTPVLVAGPSGTSFRRLLAAFVAGAVVASVVVAGVIAQLGESGPTEASPVSVPPIVPPSPAAKQAPSRPAKKAPAQAGNAKARTATPARAGNKGKSTTQTRASAKKQTAKAKITAPRKAAAPAPEPRRFAWAPVAGALGYRVELFRGDQQVLRETTKQPTFELGAQWRHQGRVERLTPGSYRWYVWPVLRSGAAAKAIVQARLTVP